MRPISKEKAEQARIVAMLARNFPGVAKPDELANDLRRLGIQCQRNAEKLCNECDYVDKRATLRAKLMLLKAKHAVEFEADVEGDPRGYCLKVIMPCGEYNTLGGRETGWGF